MPHNNLMQYYVLEKLVKFGSEQRQRRIWTNWKKVFYISVLNKSMTENIFRGICCCRGYLPPFSERSFHPSFLVQCNCWCDNGRVGRNRKYNKMKGFDVYCNTQNIRRKNWKKKYQNKISMYEIKSISKHKIVQIHIQLCRYIRFSVHCIIDFSTE